VNKVILIFASCVIAAAPVNAEDSWWKKGADFIKAVNSNKQEASVTESVTSALGAEDIASAFKQALSIGSENVIKQLATVDGFNSDPAIRIPLPKQLDDDEIAKAVTEAVSATGASSIRDMGRVMGELKSRYTGQMDFGKVGPMVKDQLCAASGSQGC